MSHDMGILFAPRRCFSLDNTFHQIMTTLASQGSMAINDAQEAELTFQPSDFSFLSQLLHILQKVETGEDPQEIATLAANLKASFKKCQTILDHLPGADLSPDEQARILEEEMKVLEKKK